MTNFEEKLKEFLSGQEVIEDLWVKSYEEAREEVERNTDWDFFDTAKNIFQDKLVDWVYGWLENLEDDIIKELLDEAVGDADFENIANEIIIEKHLWEEV